MHEGHTNQPAIRITYILIFRCSICQPRLEYIGAVDSGRCRRALTTAVGPTFSSSARRNWGHFKTEAFGEELLRAELHWTRKRTAKGEILIISLLRCTYQARILASTWPTTMQGAVVASMLCQRPAYLATYARLIAVSTLSQNTALSSSSKGQGSRFPCSSFVCALEPPTMICMSRVMQRGLDV